MTGERMALQHLPGIEMMPAGLGFLPDPETPAFREHQETAERALNLALDILNSGQYDLVILDEIGTALSKGVLSEDRVLEVVQQRNEETNLVMTGRGMSDRLMDQADTVTQMNCFKHGLQQGFKAQPGDRILRTLLPTMVIAGTHSGVGKTSVTLALVTALRKKGLKVQTFKVGPDFLDPSYLRQASGRPCYNLDGWMSSRAYVEELFQRTTRDADVAVIEGVMGLFDGADPKSSEGSTAEIARWLQAPVFLIVNAHGQARSLAPLVKGFSQFESGVRIEGVIANQCGSDRHRDWLKVSLESSGLPPLLGAIPRGGLPTLPSRHLGLVTADAHNLSPSVLDHLASVFEQQVSVEALIQKARRSPARNFPEGNFLRRNPE